MSSFTVSYYIRYTRLMLLSLRQFNQRLGVCFKRIRNEFLALNSQLCHLIFTVEQTSVNSGYDLLTLCRLQICLLCLPP